MSKKYTVNCQEYKIHIDGLYELPKLVARKTYGKIYVLVDQNTRKYCYPKIKSILKSNSHQLIQIPSGEKNKILHTCEQIWDKMLKQNADRSSLVINLGGGVIGDMGGFAASCYMRGVDFIQIPTTLLSQVDASVGGKLGVDFRSFKNLIGTFNSPQAVIIESSFLDTLSMVELRSGYAEVIKHALIRDAKLWEDIKGKMPSDIKNWASVIYRNVSIKKDVVENDPFERGLRKILNYGHTIGHAIESMVLDTQDHLLHGEAIAVGMICEAYLSWAKGMLNNQTFKEIVDYILDVYGTVIPARLTNHRQILANMQKDKKNKGGKVMFSLLDGIGTCKFDIECSTQELRDSFSYYNALR